jgi:hypothetical protein
LRKILAARHRGHIWRRIAKLVDVRVVVFTEMDDSGVASDPVTAFE